MDGDHRPCFYEIIAGKTMKEILIPPPFMKHLSNEMGDRATLKGPADDAWTIGLHENENGTYLREGWQDFTRFHLLGKKEFLVFSYHGNSHFSVQIYDLNGLERKGGRAKKSTRIEHTTTNIEVVKKEPTDVVADPIERERGRVFEKEELFTSNFPCYNTTNMEVVKKEPTDVVADPIEGERGRVFEKEESFTSNFPCYKCCLKRASVKTVFLLQICRPFSQAHFPPYKTHMVLRNSKGKGWVVNVIPAPGKHSFSGGWRSFVVENGLKEGDACIFELVQKTEMQVHVFRAGKRLTLLSEM